MKTATAALVIVVCAAGCARGPKPTAMESANGALAELRSAVVREVKEPDRAAQGTGLIDEVEALLVEASAELKVHDARIRALNTDYDAREDDFRAVFRDFNSRRYERQRRLLDIDQRAKALLTVEEWAALRKVREEALEKTIQAGREG